MGESRKRNAPRPPSKWEYIHTKVASPGVSDDRQTCHAIHTTRNAPVPHPCRIKANFDMAAPNHEGRIDLKDLVP